MDFEALFPNLTDEDCKKFTKDELLETINMIILSYREWCKLIHEIKSDKANIIYLLRENLKQLELDKEFQSGKIRHLNKRILELEVQLKSTQPTKH